LTAYLIDVEWLLIAERFKSLSNRGKIEIVITILILAAIAAVVIPNMRRAGGPNSRYPQKQCYANMRVILGAVEMYNLNNEVGIKKVSSIHCTTRDSFLVKAKMLKKPIVPPTDKCEYYTKGLLLEKGAIFCTEHGCVEKPKELKKLGIIEDTK
jgi:competence protein ComGC